MSGLYRIHYSDGVPGSALTMCGVLNTLHNMRSVQPDYRPVAVEPVPGSQYRVVSDTLPAALWHPLDDVAKLRERVEDERPRVRGVQIRSPR